jgi:hypothetical protein
VNLTVTGTPERFAPALAEAMDFVIATGLRHDHDLTMKPPGNVLHSRVNDIRTHRSAARRLRPHDGERSDQRDSGRARPAGRRDPAGPEIGTP